MRLVLGIASVLGLVGPIAAFGLFYLGDRVFHLGHPELQTLMYLLLSVAGHLTIFLTRTRGPFWSIRPAKILWIAVLGTQTIATLIAVYGLFMTPIGWKLAGLVWGYAIVWALLTDRVKLLGYRFLDHEKADKPKPEAKADEPKPEAKADEPKPEAKAETKPDAKADEPKPEAKAESKPDAKADEPKPDAKADEPKPEAKAETKPDAKADEPKPDAKVEPKPAAKADEPKPEAKADEPKPDSKPDEPKPGAKADEPKPDAKVEPKPEAKADEPKPEAKADEPKSEAKDKPKPDVTPQLVKRVHELYEELGREEVQSVQDWEKSDRELEEHDTHK
jgi:H+-transporting ATPase